VHSVYLIVDSLTSSWRRKYYRRHPVADRITNLIGPFFVFGMVAFALVFFRAVTMPNIVYQMHHLGDGLSTPISSLEKLYYNYSRLLFGLTGLATAGALGIELLDYLRQRGLKAALSIPRFSALPVPLRWLIHYAGIAVAVTLHQQNVHFIYVQF